MTSPLLTVLAVLAVLTVSMAALSVLARRLPAGSEWPRKVLHGEMGLVTLAFPALFASIAPVILLAALSLLAFRLIRACPGLQSIAGVLGSRESHGESWFVCGVLASFAVAAHEPWAYGTAILVLTLADSAAALVGVRWGRPRSLPGGARKSGAGSAAFFTVAFATTVGMLAGSGVGAIAALNAGLLVALVCTAIEALLADGPDNFLVPLGALAALEASIA